MSHPSWRAALGMLLVVITTLGCAPASAPARSASATASPSSSQPPSIDVSPSPASARPSASGTAGTVAEIARLRALVAANPGDAESQRALGFALTQRVRETADPSLYAPAQAAFEAALKVDPDDALALVGVAGIQLGKHRFADALTTAERAIALSPGLVPAHAARVDALVELGRYDEADAAVAKLFGLSSDLTTLARVSYVNELHGRADAALTAMRMAVASPGQAPENTAYVQALYGNLLVLTGDRAGAEAAYEGALDLVPDHPPSLAGQGRLAVADGRLEDAIALFGRAAAVVPLPEYVIALGDAQEAAGHGDDAATSYDLARAEIRLFESAGVVVDVDLALFEADHGDAAKALAHAHAALAATPTVRAEDAVAWALHRLGRDRDALAHVTKALRLGSIDPILRYHAGAIEAALGDPEAARRDLGEALRRDAGFSATGAAEARRILATLGG